MKKLHIQCKFLTRYSNNNVNKMNKFQKKKWTERDEKKLWNNFLMKAKMKVLSGKEH